MGITNSMLKTNDKKNKTNPFKKTNLSVRKKLRQEL